MRRIIGCVLLCAAVACGSGANDASSPSLVSGSPSKLDAALRSMRGKPVVVNYWATWCVPCTKEMPRIVRAASKYANDVRFLGVDIEDDGKEAGAFAARYKMPFRSLADPSGAIRRSEKLLGLPVTQFYAADGDLAYVHQGEIRTAELERRIEDLLSGR